MTNVPDSEGPEVFYESIRAQDSRLRAIEHEAVKLVSELIGYEAVDVGSFGLLLNLPGSDLDLAVGVPPPEISRVLDGLRAAMKFKGERKTTDTTTRHIFAFVVDDVEIDLGVLPDTDLRILVQGLIRCRAEMTRVERIEQCLEEVATEERESSTGVRRTETRTLSTILSGLHLGANLVGSMSSYVVRLSNIRLDGRSQSPG